MANMEQIVIDGMNFTTLPAMKYWTHPKSYEESRKRKEAMEMCTGGDYLGARKYDGFWSMLILDNEGKFHFRSRTPGVDGGFVDKAEWIPHITEELSWLPNGTVLLGEICFPNNEGSRKVTSVLNCLKEKCLERQQKNGYLHFYAFDILAYNGKNIMDVPFEERIETYLTYNLADISTCKYVFLAEYKSGQELWDMCAEILDAGGEGIVITKRDAHYCPGKRTARMTLKIKKEIKNTIDAFLDGSYKSATKEYSGKEIETWPFWYNDKTEEKVNTNKFREYISGEPWIPITKPYYYGWASSVSFSVMKEGKPVHIGYISGIPDSLKEGIISDNASYKNKVYELVCMQIEHIDGQYSLRHAKIVQERPDKAHTDCDFSQISE